MNGIDDRTDIPAPTSEPELTSPVDLCAADGGLAAGARGWSRRPVHTANLSGTWGRNKRWDYWAILAGDLVVSVTYADVDYLGIAAVWTVDLSSGESSGRTEIRPLARGIDLPDQPGSRPLTFRGRRLRVRIEDDPPDPATGRSTHLRAEWLEADGTPARLVAEVENPKGHESLNVVIPWSGRRFQYTSKHQARPASGTLQLGDRRAEFGGPDDPAWGVLDVGRGRWPYRTTWNWGGGAGTAQDGATVGIQIGGRWTEGTGFTENGVIVDGRLHKVGRELRWDYDRDAPMRPWRVTDPGGALDLALMPRYDRHDHLEVGVLGTEVHQVFGLWSGRVRGEDGVAHEISGIQGFAEESRSRW